VAKTSAERVRAHRERKAAGQTVDWQVKALVEEVRILGDLVGSLAARIEALEGKPFGMGAPIPATQNNALAQLRAQIAAVPAIRKIEPPPHTSESHFGNQMPVQPFGEWESA